MYETVDEHRFVDVMQHHGFSRDGARALFEMLEYYEEEIGIAVELDPVALRSDFTEYASAEEAASDIYGREEARNLTEKEAFYRIEHDSGMIAPVIGRDGHFHGYVIQKF